MATDHKVKLSGPDGTIVFEASVPIQEDRSASYSPFSIVHLPTTLHSYHSTNGRKFSIMGQLISRNAEEANQNARYLDYARKWALSDLGATGATPPILFLKGYRNSNLNSVQVVLTSYGWSFPDDVDYIYEADNPMPVKGVLQLTLDEVYSAEQITAGDWRMDTAAGGYFNRESFSPITEPGFNVRNSLHDFISGTAPVPSIGGLLASYGVSPQTGPGIIPTIPGNIAGQLTRNLGTKILNSPAVREITKGLPPVVSNIFVGGSNVLLGQVGRAVTTGVSAVTGGVRQAAPSFSRGPTLATPTYIPND